jgi:hypothetical protein
MYHNDLVKTRCSNDIKELTSIYKITQQPSTASLNVVVKNNEKGQRKEEE